MTAVHCMDVPSGNSGTDFLIDFPGDIIRLHDNHGFKFIARYAIWKELLAVRNRTMAGKNLAHRTVVEDSSRCLGRKRRLSVRVPPQGREQGSDQSSRWALEYSGERVVPADLLRYRGWTGNS